MKVVKLTPKQQAFADFYIENKGNATEAAKRAGYSARSARQIGEQNLSKHDIKAYIENRMEELKSERVVDQQEVLEAISRIIRGEEEGTALIGVGKGAQVVVNVPPTVTEKLKAAETMGKLYSLWTEKVQVENITPTFVEDVPDND